MDKVAVEILRNQFEGVVEEMGHAIMRAGHTVFVKETADFSACLVTPGGGGRGGEVFAAHSRIGIWLQVGWPVDDCLKAMGAPQEGDVWIANDPVSTGGLSTHLPDIFAWKPIFVRGDLVCFAWTFIHFTDVSGMVGGSVAPSAYEQYQEGIIIPPVRLIAAGTMNEEVLRLVLANTRIPAQNWGDLKALLGALATAERRVHQLAEKHGLEAFRAGMAGVLDYAEAQARGLIGAIPDGTYTFADYLEGDFLPDRRPIRIKLHLVVTGADLLLDFSETDPQVRAALNLPTHGKHGHYMIVPGIVNYFRSRIPDITYNSGLVRPVRVRIPRGTLLNPEPFAACGARQATLFRVPEVIMGALAQAVPDQIPAAGAGQGSILFVAAPDPRTGAPRVSIVQPLVGGSGARPNADGTDGVDFVTGFYRNIPTETLENDMPVLVERCALRPDSGGPGRWRGGAGIEYALTVIPPNAVLTSRAMERYHFQPWGRDGGRPGANGITHLREAGGPSRSIGKIDVLHPAPGATVIIGTPGGGGFGDPLERDPEHVLRDVEDGFVSPDAAARDYGVAFADGKVDAERTAALRHARRAARGAAAAGRFTLGPFREAFEARWPDALQTAVNAATAGYPAALRDYIRRTLMAEVDRRRDGGEAVPPEAIPALLALLARQHGLLAPIQSAAPSP
jgi:N-methylhydantoinase B